jgi:hypothetical protein
LVSALALIYSTIDALAALSRPINEADTNRKVFKKWVNDYMELQKLNCSADDIYGARCGVLHTYKTESRESRQGSAKRLVYMWRSGSEPNPTIAAGALVICVEDLSRVSKMVSRNLLRALTRTRTYGRGSGATSENFCATSHPRLLR